MKSGDHPPLDSGFTLIEVTLALAIVAFTVIALLGLSSIAPKEMREATDDILLINIAQKAITQWRASGWDEMTATDDYFSSEGESCAQAEAIYKVSVQPSTATPPEWPTAGTGFKAINISVDTVHGGSTVKSVSFPIGVARYE